MKKNGLCPLCVGLAAGVSGAVFKIVIKLLKWGLCWAGVMPMKPWMAYGTPAMQGYKMGAGMCPYSLTHVFIMKPILMFVAMFVAGWVFAVFYNKFCSCKK